MLSIFESSIALEIKDSVDGQQLQNVTTAEGNYQFYCLHKWGGGVTRPSMSACLIESKKGQDIGGHRRT